MDGDLNAVSQRWEAWWEHTNDRPVISITYPATEVDYGPYIKPWMAPFYTTEWTTWRQEFAFGHAVELTWRTGDARHVEDALDLLEYYASVTGHAGEGFPFLFANLGAAMMPAFITNYTQFTGDTIWVGVEPPWSWEQINELSADHTTTYKDVAMQAIAHLCQRLQGKFVIAPPELGGVLDVVAGIRGTMNLLTDVIDCPDQVHCTIDFIERLRGQWDDELDAIIDPVNSGCYAKTMRYLAGKPTYIGSCDFSAMISPAMFEEFALPTLVHETQKYPGRVIYHLDGPGEIPHIGLLCAMEGLHGIQWVTGAGNPGNFDPCWDDLYRRILDAGKRICLCTAPRDKDTVEAFFKKFPAREFFVPFVAKDEAEAREILSWNLWTR